MASTSSEGSREVCNVCGVGNEVLRKKRGKPLRKVPSGSIVIPPTVPPEKLQGAKPNLLCPKDYNLNMARQSNNPSCKRAYAAAAAADIVSSNVRRAQERIRSRCALNRCLLLQALEMLS